MTAFTVRLDDEKTRKLDQLATKLDRSRSYLVAHAIDDFLAREEWRVAEIEAGLAEADQGEFATADDLSPNTLRCVPIDEALLAAAQRSKEDNTSQAGRRHPG